MPTSRPPLRDLALDLSAAWGRLERSLDASLGGARGIRFSEYRLLRALADAPDGRASRVDLAQAVGLTPSGVTRALQPLEKLRMVATERCERDARLALASLTEAGRGVVDDASGVIDDVVGTLLRERAARPTVAGLLGALGRG